VVEPIADSKETTREVSASAAAEPRLLFRFDSPVERLASLDFLRGGAIFFMVLFNALYFYQSVPNWLKHAPADGLTLPDLGVPIFLFALGVSYRLSFSRWLEKTGKKKTLLHFLFRFLILWAFGFFGELMVFGHFTWGVLAMIGAVGLYCLPLLFLPPFQRLLVSFLLLAAYQGALLAGMPVLFMEDGLGGPFAVFAWAFPAIVAASCGTWMQEKRWPKKMMEIMAAGFGLISLGLILSPFIPFNKHKVSLPYVVFTSGLSLIVFLFSFILMDIGKLRIAVFTSLGKNPLIIYMLSGVLTLGLKTITPEAASFTLLLAESLVVLLINYAVAKWLDRRGLALRV